MKKKTEPDIIYFSAENVKSINRCRKQIKEIKAGFIVQNDVNQKATKTDFLLAATKRNKKKKINHTVRIECPIKKTPRIEIKS